VLAKQAGATVYVVDLGVAADLAPGGNLIDKKVAKGTADLRLGPAMTRDQALQAIAAGIEVADQLVDAGHDCLLTGDMGIANTTPSAALIAAFTGAAPKDVTGRGTGIDDPTLAVKVAVIEEALARPRGEDAVDVLASLGGFEHGGIAGFILGAAARRIPVILDGVIAGSAALVAQALAADSTAYCFAGHRSVEPGHVVALTKLGLRPLVDLDLRLGEGTGAALAFPIVEAAGAVLRDMATFDSAGVASKDAQ
jgi:nicotinate-nucleotide--dimethylbenzimidazole phosphoribosyltransferase